MKTWMASLKTERESPPVLVVRADTEEEARLRIQESIDAENDEESNYEGGYRYEIDKLELLASMDVDVLWVPVDTWDW